MAPGSPRAMRSNNEGLVNAVDTSMPIQQGIIEIMPGSE
jgi:hypothetical protein